MVFMPDTSPGELVTPNRSSNGAAAWLARPWVALLLDRLGLALALYAAYCCAGYTLLVLRALYGVETYYDFEDYLDLIALGVCGAVFVAGVAARAAGRLAWLDSPGLVYWQQATLRYVLAYVIVSYGIAKIFGEQFYSLPSTLDTPLRDVSGLQLTWRFFGYSYAYTLYVAAAQIGGSLLLLFRRTATLGALSLLPVFSNIVFINFTHEIPVKLFSAALLAFILYLLLLDHARLGALLLTDGAVGASRLAAPPFRRTRAAAAAKALVILLIFAANVGTSYFFYLEDNRKGPLHGVWEVEEFQVNGSPRTSREDPEVWERVYFERGGITAVKTAAPRPRLAAAEVDVAKRAITLRDYKTWDETVYSYEPRASDVLFINFEKGPDRIRVLLRKRAG